MNTPTIKNIIFDLGNVIVDIDFKRTVAAFSQLSTKNLDLSVEAYINDPIFGGLEKGEFSTADFRQQVRELLGTQATDEQIDQAWAAVIINSDQQRMDLLKKLSKTHRIFLLSNTNEIHINRACYLFKKHFDVDFLPLFERSYLSHELGMAKPNKDIYHHVLNDANITAQETLFIDDNGPNIQAAKQLGIICHHYTPGTDDLCEVVHKYI